MLRYRNRVSIKTMLIILAISLSLYQLCYAAETYSVSQGTYQRLDGLIGELVKYSQEVANLVTASTMADGAESEKVIVLKDVYNGLSIMICNLIALRLAIKIEKLHGNYKQINYEAISEVKGYAGYIDMHHDIQLRRCNSILPTTRDPLLINQINAYIGHLQHAKKIIEDIKKELPV